MEQYNNTKLTVPKNGLYRTIVLFKKGCKVMKKIFIIAICLLLVGCGPNITNSNTVITSNTNSETSSTDISTSSKKQSNTTSKNKTSTSSKKKETKTSKPSTVVTTTTTPQTTSTYNELEDLNVFYQRFKFIQDNVVGGLNDTINEIKQTIDSHRTYIANNSTLNQTAYLVAKRQLDERFANAGATNSGQYNSALKALEQKYLVEQNPTVIRYRSELPKLEEDLALYEGLKDTAKVNEFCIEKICEEFGYDETKAYQMLHELQYLMPN